MTTSRADFASGTHEVSSYLMESADEGARLEKKTRAEESVAHLRMVGVQPGMRILDAGAGTGAVARVMASLVGPNGSVTALDPSAERLERGRILARGIDNLRFVQGDIYDPPWKREEFDLVFCRFVFEYLRAPERAVHRLVSLVRPGGKLVLGDLDGQGLQHFPISAELEQKLLLVSRALQSHVDPFAGRKIYHWLHSAGLKALRVHLLPHGVFAGTAPPGAIENWTQKFRTARTVLEPVLGGPTEYDKFANEFIELLRSPDTFSYSTLIYVEGVRVS